MEFQKGVADGLELTVEDYNSLYLHPATLSSLQRVTVESSFWNSRKDTFREYRVPPLTVFRLETDGPPRSDPELFAEPTAAVRLPLDEVRSAAEDRHRLSTPLV